MAVPRSQLRQVVLRVGHTLEALGPRAGYQDVILRPEDTERAAALILLFWAGVLLCVVGYLYFLETLGA